MISTMVPPRKFSVPLFCFLFSLFISLSAGSLQPSGLVLPVSKHALSLQYVTQISQRTPLVSVDVVVDLGGPFLWVSCDHKSYNSSSYRSAMCPSVLCSMLHFRKSCRHCFSRSRTLCSTKNTCVLFSQNAFSRKVSAGDLGEDVLSLQSTDGLNPISMVSVPNFLFSCAPDSLLEGLAVGAKGTAGLGHSRIGLPMQLSSAFNFSSKFAICLSPSGDSNGVIFFGDGPYVLLPGIDISKLLIYTPLIRTKHRSKGSRTYGNGKGLSRSHEYYIGVKSIRINGEQVPMNLSLLLINNRGMGGTKISTVYPYSTLQTSIYRALTSMFIREAMAANVTKTAAVAPFDICFSTKNSNGVVSRPAFPVIDLMLQNDLVFWRIFETNSMVPVGNGIVCLAFLDGGLNPRASIVIGGYQLEDNFLQFDLVSSRLGFTSSLLLRETNCANFNFTPTV